MTMSLLTTKLYIPPIRLDPSTGLRASLVPRPRLIERLNQGLLRQDGGFARKLTLISAPAGFGKTTLLSAWTQQWVCPVAWISLDTGDNDPARFWTYVIAALQTIHKGVGESIPVALQSPQPPLIEGLLTDLINEVAQVSDPFALVLDDFHVITHQLIHDGLTFLLNNVPPSIHLVLSSRADPPWPLARLRARRAMAELRARDLRFTSTEAASFLNEVMKLNLSPEEVAALEERTEGWIVGLQMAALSMRGRNDLSGFISAFSGSHRYILDYLVEEVLNQQSPDVQEFLLKTSILNRMSAPLCNAVMGGERARLTPRSEVFGEHEILTQLERANLFLIPLDDERRWYRYHHLFADLLRNRLGQLYPDQVPALHRRASAWYEGQGQIVEAVGYALAAGDIPLIERLVAENALAVIYHGELATVVRWLDALSDDVMRARPRLCVTYAWALAYAGQLDKVEPLLHDAEKALTEPEGHIAAIRAYVAALKGDIIHAAELAREALDRLPETDLTARSWTALVLQAQGEKDQALAALERALSLAEPEGYVRVFISEGAPMGQLLRQAAVRGIKLDYVSRLLAALDNEVADGRRISSSTPSPLVEPFSEREMEVLRLLITHLSSTEIAQALFIATSTVRSHIKNIYAKLNVHSRKEAVERAQDLGLL
jgi:LuxR family maltose regulon positive regulatory protein